MDILALLPVPVLLALIGCAFLFVLLLLVLVVFVPTATERIVRVIDVLQRPCYRKRRGRSDGHPRRYHRSK
jgi:hypothetical protein